MTTKAIARFAWAFMLWEYGWALYGGSSYQDMLDLQKKVTAMDSADPNLSALLTAMNEARVGFYLATICGGALPLALLIIGALALWVYRTVKP